MKDGANYRMVYESLKNEILSGKYSSRRPIPSLAASCARFGISRLTAVKVFDRLKEEGLVSSRVGSGTFVTKSARSRLIGLVIPGIAYASEFFQPIVTGADATAPHAVSLYVTPAGPTAPAGNVTRVRRSIVVSADEPITVIGRVPGGGSCTARTGKPLRRMVESRLCSELPMRRYHEHVAVSASGVDDQKYPY